MNGHSLLELASSAETAACRGATGLRSSLYQPLSWLLVRAPLLPVSAYLALPEADGSHNATGSTASPAAATAARGSLAPPDPRIRTAIAVASPDLLWALDRPQRSSRDAARARSKLLRYLIRMSTRPTPYGLFAGVALGGWAEATDLSLGPHAPATRTRPDSAWLLSLVHELESRPEIRRQLRLAANPTTFFHAGRVFLTERAPVGGSVGGSDAGSDARSIPVSMRATAAVRKALTIARRPVPYGELAAGLLSIAGATQEKVDALLTELWRHTLLLTDLRPPLTVASPARYVAGRLALVSAAEEDVRRLQAILEAMASWDERPWEQGEAGYRTLAAAVAVGHDASSSAPPIQVDMALPLEGRSLARTVGEEVAGAAELLLRITPSPVRPAYLLAYRRAFEAKYGAEREVGLLEMLDPSFGLGPPVRYGGAADANVDASRLAARQQTLRDLAATALRERVRALELDEETIARLETWAPSRSAAPLSLELSVFVLASSTAAIDRGEFQIVIGPNLGAAAAGRTLGRFADLLGPAAVASLDEAARAERAHAPARLWTEMVYLPHRSRSANVVIRPLVREHEIAIGTTPSVPPERVIPLDELVVGLTTTGFYVRWPAAQMEIMPSAGHMLNSSHAPDVCRFLDDVSRDGVAQISAFDWGPAWGLPFLPRVQAGRTILSPAQWSLDDRTLRSVQHTDAADWFHADLGAWRDQWQVPRYVYLSVGDNRLLLDLEDRAQAGELGAELRRSKAGQRVLLQEALPAPGDAWMAGPGGRFLSELVVPIVLRGTNAREGAEERAAPGPPRSVPQDVRLRPPGSDWLFAKLYCPPAFETDLIAGPMLDFCEGVRLAGLVEGWFFVRYADPSPHIRLRFRGAPGRLVEDLLPQLCSWANGLVQAGTCSRFALDTYEREVERYGGAAAAPSAEDVFAADSRLVAELLALVESQSVHMDLLTASVLTIDDLLAALGLSAPERLEWYKRRVPSAWQTGKEYRDRQRELRALVGDPGELLLRPGGDAVAALLRQRREALAPVRRRLDELEARGDLSQPRDQLYRSHVHLHCNRLAGSDRSLEERALGLLLRTWQGLRQTPVSARDR